MRCFDSPRFLEWLIILDGGSSHYSSCQCHILESVKVINIKQKEWRVIYCLSATVPHSHWLNYAATWWIWSTRIQAKDITAIFFMDEHHKYHMLHPQRKLHFLRKNANANVNKWNQLANPGVISALQGNSIICFRN